ncbi:hypothetical protein BDP67DRAFT_531650 [Colletotrichum lupini]|nr:hypothetical protein BDP67DRAFT_531650 [Colletotrichum lupini]
MMLSRFRAPFTMAIKSFFKQYNRVPKITSDNLMALSAMLTITSLRLEMTRTFIPRRVLAKETAMLVSASRSTSCDTATGRSKSSSVGTPVWAGAGEARLTTVFRRL